MKIADVMENAAQNQVQLMQTICTKISAVDSILKYCADYDHVYGSVGLHPNRVDEEGVPLLDQLLKIIEENPKIIGIGETGLDYYYEQSDRAKQKESFLIHIKAAQKTDLPLIIHSRNADQDMMEILEREQKHQSFPALLHCFTSTRELALKALELKMMISISGIVTFKNATDLQELVKFLPLENLLVETDSPYLAPMPYRGQANQPAYTKQVVEFIAKLKEISADEVAAVTTANFFRIFKRVKTNQ